MVRVPARGQQEARFTLPLRIRARGSLGSGVLVYGPGDSKLVLTASHVVSDVGRGSCEVVWADGGSTTATVLAINRAVDYAILDPEDVPTDAVAVHVQDGESEIGDRLTISGYGSNGRILEQRGRVSRFNRRSPWVTIEGAQARPGDSGGPVYAESGEVAGLLWGASSGETVAVCAGPLRDALDRLRDKLRPAPSDPGGDIVGPRGPPGEDGKNGRDGKDGASVSHGVIRGMVKDAVAAVAPKAVDYLLPSLLTALGVSSPIAGIGVFLARRVVRRLVSSHQQSISYEEPRVHYQTPSRPIPAAPRPIPVAVPWTPPEPEVRAYQAQPVTQTKYVQVDSGVEAEAYREAIRREVELAPQLKALMARIEATKAAIVQGAGTSLAGRT